MRKGISFCLHRACRWDGTPARQSHPKADPCAAPEHPVGVVRVDQSIKECTACTPAVSLPE